MTDEHDENLGLWHRRFLESRAKGASELQAWELATAERDPELTDGVQPRRVEASDRIDLSGPPETIAMTLGGLVVLSEREDLFIGAARVPNAKGHHVVWAHRHFDDPLDVRLWGGKLSKMHPTNIWDHTFLVPFAESIEALLEEHCFQELGALPYHAYFSDRHELEQTFHPGDASWLGSRAFWLAAVLTGVPNHDSLPYAGGPADHAAESKRFAKEPWLLAYWLLRHAVLVDDARLVEAEKAASESDHRLVREAVQLARALRDGKFPEKFGLVQRRALKAVREDARKHAQLGLPTLPENAKIDVPPEEPPVDPKAQFDEAIELPDSPAKRAAIAAFFTDHAKNPYDQWRVMRLARALAYVRTTPDERWGALLAALPGSVDVQICLARVAPDLARTKYGGSKKSDTIWARLALDPADADAIADAVKLFDPYEKLSVVKASDAEKIGNGAMALVLTRDAAHLERIRPFADGKKLIGAVAKAAGAAVKALLESEGLSS